MRGRRLAGIIWLTVLGGCCAHWIDVDTFRQRTLNEQIGEYKRGVRDHCIRYEGARAHLLSAMSGHGVESADAMTELLRHPDPNFPVEDAMDVLEFVQSRGTNLRSHEAVRVLADLERTAGDGTIRAKAKATREWIMSHQP